MSAPRGIDPGLPVTLQILFSLKSADPTALTAAEAIRHLLGFEERLLSVERRALHEWVLAEGDGSHLDEIGRYLDRTAILWNPNKQRGWLRSQGTADPAAPEGWEILPGGRRRPGRFGQPPLSAPDLNHLLVWSRGQDATPPDLPEGLRGRLLACGSGELYTLRWTPEASPEERRDWTEAVGVARTRRQGLLVNPHYQDYRRFDGAVPLPLWGGIEG